MEALLEEEAEEDIRVPQDKDLTEKTGNQACPVLRELTDRLEKMEMLR